MIAAQKIEPNRRVVAARRAPCAAEPTLEHVTAVRCASGDTVSAADLVDLIAAGRDYFMDAPPSMRLVAPSGETLAADLPIILQVRTCPHCGQRVPFA